MNSYAFCKATYKHMSDCSVHCAKGTKNLTYVTSNHSDQLIMDRGICHRMLWAERGICTC